MYLAYPFDSEERLTTMIFDTNQGIDVARPITFLLTGLPFVLFALLLSFVCYEDDPNMTAITPTLGPSQGGTEVAISGEGFETYTPPANKWGTDFPTHFHPLLRVTMATKVIDFEVDGYETEAVYYQRQHVDVQPGWSYDLLKARMPPQLLNETDITISVSMEISFNRQNWFAAPGTFVVYDPSRIVYKQALTIAQLEHLNVLWAGAQRTTTGNGEHILLAVNEEARDTNKLWIPFPAHGVEDITEGMPILCGSTVRLRHARTARNLHASSDDSPTVHQFNTGDYSKCDVTLNYCDAGTYGINGHGNTGDDWVIECDNNFEHEYPYDWESIKWDKRFHSERYEFVRRNRNR